MEKNHKKFLWSIALCVQFLIIGGAWGQVTVTNPSNTTPAMSATYTSLALAIADVNNRTAISGPVTITLDASSPQTAPAGGYSITNVAITGGSTTNRFIFDGGGNTITAGVGTSATNDAIFKLIGADFITLQNFVMVESAANTTATQQVEWGVALLYASTTNGAQNNIIQNNTISLKRTYSNTFGIYSNVRHTATAPTTAADITLATGSNSGNKIYSNTISNVDYGIVFVGSIAAAAMDNGNDIGGSSASTANTITNWGGLVSGAISSYTGVTGSNVCIYMNHQINENVSFNTITSATNITTITTQGFLGILKSYATTQPTGTITATYNNNTITLTNTGATTSQMTGMGLQSMTALSTATFNCNNNNIINCVNSGTTAAMIGMLHSSAPGTFNISGNIIRGFTSSVTGTGSVIGIQQQTNGVVTALNITNNKLGDATAGFVTFSGTANSSTVSGFVVTSTGAAATCAVAITGNDIRGIVHTNVGGGAHLYISNAAASLSQNISSNTFTNLNVSTTGSVTFLSNSVTVSATGAQTISSNSIVTAFNKTGAGGTITLCTSSASSTAGAAITHNLNNFSNITVNGATTIAGWISTDGGTANKTYNGNTFNNWIGGSSSITGMSCSFGGGNGGNGNVLSNNTVTNITGTGTITGINLGSSGTTHTANNNTITGLSSTGTGGSVTGIASAAPTGNIFSNIINNLSTTSTTATVAGITTSASANIYQNTINTLSCVGTTSGVTNGIMVTGGTTVNVYRNKIYDLATTGAFTTTPGVNGIVLSAGTTVNTYNNLIGDLKAITATSTDAIRGISITSTTTSSSYNLYNNSVYLTGSGGANFGTSGIYHTANSTASTAKLDLQNNMIFNTCTPSGSGIVTAFRRSAGAASNLANYASTSNKNLFYAGTPGASNLIYSDGTSSAQTMASYQAGVFTAGTIASRDANSFTETSFNPATYFVSTTGSNANFLQPASGITTQAEGGGNTITMCSPDYNGVTRPGFSGAAYDVGAWEFAGVSPAPVLTNMTPSPALTAQCTKAARAISIDITTASGTITGATLNYNHNGTAQTAVTMTNSSGNTWTGTMLAPSTGNATVTWSITATNSLGLSTLYSGTSYADEPTTGITATATATPSTVCEGSNASLSVSLAKSGTSSTIGSGTAVNSTSSNTGAFYGTWWGNSRTQILITASELTAAGLSAGNITGLNVNVTGGTLALCTGFTIKIGATNASSISTSFATPTFTTVYGPLNYTPTLGVNTHTFSTSFNWDGSSNIIVEYCFSNLVTGTNSATNTTTTTSFASSVLYGADGTTAACGNATVSTSTSVRANILLVGNTAPTPSAYSWSNGTTVVGTTNPLSTPITSGLTYTATATVNGCPMTAVVTPTVNPLPTAPTATPSSQCGAGIPTASVADNNGYASPVFRWYSANTGGTMLQTGASATYLTSISATTTFYVAVVGTNTCESARTAVTVTISQPDAISAVTSAAAICLGQSVTLTAANTATTPTQSYTYSWACATTGSGATSANTNNPASVTPTVAGSYTYTVTATDGGCSAVNTVALTVNALPNITSATATPSAVCSGAAITLTGASVPASAGTATVGSGSSTSTSAASNPFYGGYGGVISQYLIKASELTALNVVAGNISNIKFDVTAVGSPLSGLGISIGNTTLSALTSNIESNPTSVYYNASYTPVTGINTMTFSSPFNWDGVSNIIVSFCWSNNNTSNTATTLKVYSPGFTSSNARYVDSKLAADVCSYTGSATPSGWNGASTTSTSRPIFIFNGQVGTNQTSSYSWSWNSTPAITTATGSTTETNTGASATSKTYTVTATNATTGCVNTATTSPISINPVTAAPTATNSSQCGTATPTCSVTGTGTSGNTFKWYLSATGGTALVGQTANTLSSYPVSATTSFYVSEFNGTCESARVQVDVTIIAAPTISAAASVNPVCSGSATTLSVTSANSGYTYSWNNSAGTGASVSVSPTSATIYTVTATDNSSGCITTATVPITINAVPLAITLTPASASICFGSTQSIVASGGNNNIALLNPTGEGGFETGATFSLNNWTEVNGVNNMWSVGTAAGVQAGTNAALIGNANVATANSSVNHFYKDFVLPAGLTNINLSFYLKMAIIDDGYDYLDVYTTTITNTPLAGTLPGTGYNLVFSNTADTYSGYTLQSISLPNSLAGTTIRLVFTYESDGVFPYSAPAIDNISLSATAASSYAWSPTATLFTDAAATTAYTGNPTTVYAKPTGNTTYTATATNAAGCTSSASVAVTIAAPSTQTLANNDYVWRGTTNTDWSTPSNWLSYNGTAYSVATTSPLTSNNVFIPQNNTCVLSQPNIGTGSVAAKNLFIESSATVTGGSGSIEINGNFTNNGTFTPETGTVSFIGTTAQQVTGATTFYNLTQNNAAGLTLNNPVTVSNDLTMTAGNITSSNLLTLGNNAPATLTWTSGNVVGPMKRWMEAATNSGNASSLFPLGTATREAKVSLEYTVAPTTAGYLEAKYVESDPTVAVLYPVPLTDNYLLDNVDAHGYWEIAPSTTTGVDGGDYTLTLQADAILPTVDYQNYRIIKSPMPHNVWELDGTHAAGSGTAADFTVSRTEMSGFSYFALASPSAATLPTELVSFAANCEDNNSVAVNWTTASEHNSDYFIVEKSRDGVTWNELKKIAAAGNSTQLINYSVADASDINGTVYYRLSQYDIDGASKVYDIVSTNCSAENELAMVAYPNPSNGQFTVKIENALGGSYTLGITDMQGKAIEQQNIQLETGTTVVKLNPIGLKPGVYLLQLVNASTIEKQLKLVVN